MADDDLPLSSLAPIDEDLPLAMLAPGGASSKATAKPGVKTAPKPAAAKASTPAQKPGAPKSSLQPAVNKAKVKAKPGGAPGKKKGDGSSSSSSSDSSSDSDDARPARKKALKLVVKRKAAAPAEAADEEQEDQSHHKVEKRSRSNKQKVVAELLSRWWYALPDWPPADEEYYTAELSKLSLRKVPIAKWEWVPEQDDKGRRKVYELSQFRGLFRTSTGEMIDTRPKDTCPCYTNFMKKELPELHELLVIAYENQIKDLQNSKYNEERFEKELQILLKKARQRAHEVRQLGSAPKRRANGD